MIHFTPDPFVPGERFHRKGAATGPLAGLRFAAKDNFDVAGRRTRLGLADGGKMAEQDADLVAHCLAVGAALLGKTLMDELAFSLLGLNAAFGAPLNPAALGCVAGGSSCGSASVVAQGLTDFSLGTDTAGSIRVPASFCGVWGLRPTHGVLSTHGMAPLAASFDVPGWLCADAKIMRRVSEALLPPAPLCEIQTAIVCDWLFAGDASPRDDAAAWAKDCGLAVSHMAAPPLAVEEMLRVFRALQTREAYQALGAFLDNPSIPEDIKARLRSGAESSPETFEAARSGLRALAVDLEHALERAILLLPAAPPPFLLSELDHTAGRESARTRILTHTVLASLGGLPQIVMPMWRDQRGPVGLGLIGARGGDRALLDLCIPGE